MTQIRGSVEQILPNFDSVALNVGYKLPQEYSIIFILLSLCFHFGQFDFNKSNDLGKSILWDNMNSLVRASMIHTFLME